MQSPHETHSSARVETVEVPLVAATTDALAGIGRLVDDFESEPIEIVPWPAQGRRPVDPGTGDQGGTTDGVFEFWWRGEVFHGRNNAVNDTYVLGWCRDPRSASESAKSPDRSSILLRHANYHPDGGQLFYPLDGDPFVVPLAPAGDDVRPEDFIAYYFDGSQGLYIHPGVWHEAVFPLAEEARFFDRQGKVHARVSCRFDEEFGVYLSVPLRRP